MATQFDMRVNFSITPKETTTLSDGVDTCLHLNSNIDKILNGHVQFEDVGDFDDNPSAAQDWHYYKSVALTNTSYSDLNTLLGGASFDNGEKFFIGITSQQGSTGASFDIQYDNGVDTALSLGTMTGVGDFTYFGIEAQGNIDDIKLRVTVNYECTVDILIWGNQDQ